MSEMSWSVVGTSPPPLQATDRVRISAKTLRGIRVTDSRSWRYSGDVMIAPQGFWGGVDANS